MLCNDIFLYSVVGCMLSRQELRITKTGEITFKNSRNGIEFLDKYLLSYSMTTNIRNIAFKTCCLTFEIFA